MTKTEKEDAMKIKRENSKSASKKTRQGKGKMRSTRERKNRGGTREQVHPRGVNLWQ